MVLRDCARPWMAEEKTGSATNTCTNIFMCIPASADRGQWHKPEIHNVKTVCCAPYNLLKHGLKRVSNLKSIWHIQFQKRGKNKSKETTGSLGKSTCQLSQPQTNHIYIPDSHKNSSDVPEPWLGPNSETTRFHLYNWVCPYSDCL
jgi:hypothetical protein